MSYINTVLLLLSYYNVIYNRYLLHIGMYYIGEGNATPLQHSCPENPMDGGAGGLQSMGSLRVRHDWATSLSLFTFMHWRRKWQLTPVFLPGESQGRGSQSRMRLKQFSSSSMYYIVYNDINVYRIVNMCSGINRLKKEIYGERSFNHNQHSFMIKILTFLGI